MLSTAQKVAIARLLSRMVMLGRRMLGKSPRVTARRAGFMWQLDLQEGIDLAIYLLGAFEPGTVRMYRRLVRPGDTVLDIGANIGAHTLHLARLVGDEGRVCAYEPTRYAYDKLTANLALNPILAGRVVTRQTMLVAKAGAPMQDAIYSSWPLASEEALHEKHCGRLMDTRGGSSATLDAEVEALGLDRLDLIKLDVDGNEADVLDGGAGVIRRLRPSILLELAPYVYEGHPGRFASLLHGLWDAGYELQDIAGGGILVRDVPRVIASIPRDGGINVLARPL